MQNFTIFYRLWALLVCFVVNIKQLYKTEGFLIFPPVATHKERRREPKEKIKPKPVIPGNTETH